MRRDARHRSANLLPQPRCPLRRSKWIDMSGHEQQSCGAMVFAQQPRNRQSRPFLIDAHKSTSGNSGPCGRSGTGCSSMARAKPQLTDEFDSLTRSTSTLVVCFGTSWQAAVIAFHFCDPNDKNFSASLASCNAYLSAGTGKWHQVPPLRRKLDLVHEPTVFFSTRRNARAGNSAEKQPVIFNNPCLWP